MLLIPKLTTRRATARSSPTTPCSAATSSAAAGCASSTCEIGKHAFLGNSGMAAPGPQGAQATAWSPCCPRRRAGPRRRPARRGWAARRPSCAGSSRRSTAAAPTTRRRRLMVARAAGRAVPAGAGDGRRRHRARRRRRPRGARRPARGWWAAALLSGLVADRGRRRSPAVVTTLAKWVLVGRLRVGDHPLWSSFVWRNELADTFVETVAAPWFARPATGTPVLNLWLRSLGARIGRGVWCETYWLPEADLVHLQRGRHGQPGLRGADPPVPRPGPEHGHRHAADRLDARPQQRDPARRRRSAGTRPSARRRW